MHSEVDKSSKISHDPSRTVKEEDSCGSKGDLTEKSNLDDPSDNVKQSSCCPCFRKKKKDVLLDEDMLDEAEKSVDEAVVSKL